MFSTQLLLQHGLSSERCNPHILVKKIQKKENCLIYVIFVCLKKQFK